MKLGMVGNIPVLVSCNPFEKGCQPSIAVDCGSLFVKKDPRSSGHLTRGVYCSLTLHDIPHTQQNAVSFFRVCKPGGCTSELS